MSSRKRVDIDIVSYFAPRNYQNAEAFESIENSAVVTAVVGPRQRISVYTYYGNETITSLNVELGLYDRIV